MNNQNIIGTVLTAAAVPLLSTLSLVGILLSGKATGTEALLFPPWWNAETSFLAAAETGPVLSTGGLPFVVLVPSNIHRDRARGEWLHFHAAASRGCFPAGV